MFACRPLPRPLMLLSPRLPITNPTMRPFPASVHLPNTKTPIRPLVSKAILATHWPLLALLQVLLPFTFNQGAIDAISGTQPKPAAEKSEAVSSPQGGRRLLMRG